MEKWSHKSENIKPKQEIGERLIHRKAVVVFPGFEVVKIDPQKPFEGKKDPKREHYSGLLFETRIKLFAAALLWKNGEVERVVVGGAQIREMKESFANLMKADLINFGVPKEFIDTEEQTIDTSTQVSWIEKNKENEKYGNSIACLTDPNQAKHVQALLEGYKLKDVPVLETEAVIIRLIPKNQVNNFKSFFARIDKSPWGIKYKLREELLSLFTKYLDPKNEILRNITKNRVSDKNS